MQIDALIPAELSIEKVIEHVGGFDQVSLVQSLAELGFDPVELGGDLSLFMPHTLARESIQRLQELKELQGLSYTVHLPLWSVEPSTPLNPVREVRSRRWWRSSKPPGLLHLNAMSSTRLERWQRNSIACSFRNWLVIFSSSNFRTGHA
jgi:hypothetical protein